MNERLDQIGERLFRQLSPFGRSMQRDEDGMVRRRLSYMRSRSVLPPCKQAQAFRRIADLVAEIIRPAAERIDVVEVLMQIFGQQEADDMKVFVMMGREPACVGFRFAAETMSCSALPSSERMLLEVSIASD